MLTYLIGGGVGGQEGALAPQTKIGGPPPPPSTFWCRKTLLPMYLTITLTSARTFSALRRLKNSLRSTMKQERLNNNLLMHCHKSITDTMDTVKTACANEQRKGHFGKFE